MVVSTGRINCFTNTQRKPRLLYSRGRYSPDSPVSKPSSCLSSRRGYISKIFFIVPSLQEKSPLFLIYFALYFINQSNIDDIFCEISLFPRYFPAQNSYIPSALIFRSFPRQNSSRILPCTVKIPEYSHIPGFHTPTDHKTTVPPARLLLRNLSSRKNAGAKAPASLNISDHFSIFQNL